MRRFRAILWLIAAVFAALIGTVLWNAITFRSKQVQVNQVDAVEPMQGFEERLARAIQFRTVATLADEDGDAATFQQFRVSEDVFSPGPRSSTASCTAATASSTDGKAPTHLVNRSC